MDCLIVGGGAIGLLTARELRAAGASVTLLERQDFGRESSWAGGGILSPLTPWTVPDAITRLCRWSQQIYPTLAQELFRHSGIDPQWQPNGMLVRLEAADGDAVRRWSRENGVATEFLERADVARLEPNLATMERAVLLPQVGHIRNPRLLAALRAEAEASGIRLLSHQPVTDLEIASDRITTVVTESCRYQADRVVIAGGAWSGTLGKLVGLSLPIEPVRGQMLAFAGHPAWLQRIVLAGGRYLIPRRDGTILAGSTVEHAGFDRNTTAEAGSQLAEFARHWLPPLRNCPIEHHWAGLRPGSPEGIPIISRHPAIANLYFNCGHFRNGLVMGPASARLLADLVLERPPVVPAAPYRIQSITLQN